MDILTSCSEAVVKKIFQSDRGRTSASRRVVNIWFRSLHPRKSFTTRTIFHAAASNKPATVYEAKSDLQLPR